MKKTLILALSILSFQASFGQSEGLTPSMKEKHQLIAKELKAMGYKDNYSILSSKRSEAFNKLLPLAADNSLHLHGQAIDYMVGDINNDGVADGTDVNLFCQVIRQVEKKYPKYIGGLGTYKGNWLSKQMVHTDVRGYYAAWQK